MNLHLLIDFMHLFYKYKYTIESGRIRRLTTNLDIKGTTENVDISYVFYPLKEIEGFRKAFEKEGHSVTVSVCFDSKSKRSELDANYKASRIKRLTDEDLNSIEVIRELLGRAGHNTYIIPGMEADDIIANIANKFGETFDYNIIYTNDMDLLVHVRKGIGVNRYKVRKGYTAVGLKNFSDYCSGELKCNISYNNLMLYKALCGDKSDDIVGIPGFGPAAFNKLVGNYDGEFRWERMHNSQYVLEFLESVDKYLGTEAIDLAIHSLTLVAPEDIPLELCAYPHRISSKELREQAYIPLDMKSLVD